MNNSGCEKSELDPKEKIKLRIEKEKLYYRKSFRLSLTNQYQYLWSLTFDREDNGSKRYHGGTFIYGPKFTDYSVLEEAYCLAHELGHHYINKKLHPLVLRLLKWKFPIVTYIVEILAWKEAKTICFEEGINLSNDFYLVRENSLDTYKNWIYDIIRDVGRFIIHILISYYVILGVLYLMYKAKEDNLVDMFGILNYIKDFDVHAVYVWTNFMWGIYTFIKVSLLIRKKIRCFIKN